MAKKKKVSVAGRLEKAFEDVADAVSVAATGSQIGVLELAAEDEMDERPVKARRKTAAKKSVAKKKKAPARKVAAKRTVKKRPAKKAKKRR
jgi:hypothetical protein